MLYSKHVTRSVIFALAVIFNAAANANFFEVEPEVTDWYERYCQQTISRNPAVTGAYRCRAMGGTWRGLNSDPECTVEDYFQQYLSLPIQEKAELFAEYGVGFCSTPSVVFSGWGQPTHNEYLCWNSGTTYRYGVIIRDTGNFTISGPRGSSCNNFTTRISALRTRTATCPAGSVRRDFGSGDRCYVSCLNDEIYQNGQCVDAPSKDDGCEKDNLTINPCNVATGNKYRSETDFSNSSMSFSRSYNSLVLTDIGIGKGWRHNYQKALAVAANSLIVISSQGRGEPWTKTSGAWIGDADTDLSMIETSSSFTLNRQDGSFEEYNLSGEIQSETDTNGYQTVYSYATDGNLSTVTNHYGETLTFTYLDGRLETISDSLGAVYSYQYDANGNLIAVVFPDTTPNDIADNHRKIYHYESPEFPNHLTGITDENGHRYATFEYDVNGKAILSELGTTTNMVGQEKIELDYQGAN